MIENKKIKQKNIITKDETSVLFDVVGSTTADTRSARSFPPKTIGVGCECKQDKTKALCGVQKDHQVINAKHQ